MTDTIKMIEAREDVLDALEFQRIDHDDGTISYEAHGDIHFFKDTEDTIGSPTFITIEGAKAKQYAEAIQRSLLRDRVLQKIASGDDWFPIESAPKDGRDKILLRSPNYREDQVAYSNTWYVGGHSAESKPFHWKHLDQAKHIEMLMEQEMKEVEDE